MGPDLGGERARGGQAEPGRERAAADPADDLVHDLLVQWLPA